MRLYFWLTALVACLAFGQRVAPPARIVSFTAEPASVRAGQAVNLSWATENPGGLTIDPEVGKVAARGSHEVRPTATTTYTLTVGGPNNTKLTKEVIVTVTGPAPAAQISNTKVPDLNGVYGFAGVRNAVAPALKPGAEKYKIVRGLPGDVRGNTTLGTDCVPLGIPQVYVTPYPFQIVQTPKLLVMIYEYPNTFRMIPLDGRKHEVDPDPTWNGDAVGHWEGGDTLVVDSIGFNEKTEVSGYMHTADLHVMERYKKLPNGSLQYDVTVEDPNVWTAPWVLPQRTLPFKPEQERVEEFVCESHQDYGKLFEKK